MLRVVVAFANNGRIGSLTMRKFGDAVAAEAMSLYVVASPVGPSWPGSLNVMRHPQITSQSANKNSAIPVNAETSGPEPRESTRPKVSNRYPAPAGRTLSSLGT